MNALKQDIVRILKIHKTVHMDSFVHLYMMKQRWEYLYYIKWLKIL